MTICSVYIGDLEDAKFKWEGGDWNGNTPRSLSPDFPPAAQHYNEMFHGWVKSAAVECKQTDYGAWVAKVTKEQIAEYLSTACKGSEELSWVKDVLPEIRLCIEKLDENRIYALVATEY